jgi:prolipoprotein diacylglyceryltransferase
MSPFSIWVGFGAALGLWQLASRGSEKNAETHLIWGWIVLASALFGARLGYVLMYPGYFDQNRLMALAFWEGGLTWFGATAGGFVACLGLAIWHNRSVFQMIDLIFPLLPPVAMTAWVGCWFGGCDCMPDHADGQTTPFLLCSSHVGQAVGIPFHAVVALVFLAFFFWQETFFKRSSSHPSGSYAALGLTGFGLIQLAASVIPAEYAINPSGASLNTWAAVACLGISLLFLSGAYLLRKKNN